MGSAQFTDFFRHNLQCQDQLEPLREILQSSFGIDDFWHATLWENGQYANISTYYLLLRYDQQLGVHCA
ncbi:MAG: hypothetical protein LLF94_11815 [Chlamydiales bacterium]|nr:hypothetical protein [Chlamydiales bacterium]